LHRLGNRDQQSIAGASTNDRQADRGSIDRRAGKVNLRDPGQPTLRTQAGAAVTLEVDDVNFTRRQIDLTRTNTNRPRTLPFATPGGDAGTVLADVPPHGALFPSGTGNAYQNFPTHAAKVIASVGAREKAAKRPFRRFRVHDLRHGFAIRALRCGMDIYSLSRHLAHTSVKTTEIYLAHPTGDEQGTVRFAQAWGTEDVASAADD
jgi:integrase